MNQDTVVNLASQAMSLSLKVAGPLLLVGLVVGLLVISVFQAVTQIQEQSLTLIPKIVGVAVVIVLLGPWMLGQLVSYTTALYTVDPLDGGLVNALLSKLAGNELAGFILVLARVTPLFLIAPLFSSAMIPPRVRGIIAVGISIGLTPIAMHGQHVPSDAGRRSPAWSSRGCSWGSRSRSRSRCCMAALESAGAMIDVISGFSYGSLINPMNGEQSAVISRFYSLVGTLIFLVIGGDAWTLRGLGRTFELVPLTEGPQIASLVGGAEHVFSDVFAAALEIAAPVLVALLITDVAFGVVSRVVPQLNVFAVGFPTKVAVALLVVGASLPFVVQLDLRPAVGQRRRRARRAARGVRHGQATTAQRRPHPSTASARERRGRSRAAPTSAAPSCSSPACSPSASWAHGSSQAGASSFREMLGEIAHPARATTAAGLSELMHSTLATIALAVGPIAGACMVAGVLAGVAQVGFKPSAHVLKPDFRRINPASGLKNLLGPNLIFETVKTIAKVGVVGARSPRSRFCPGSPTSLRRSASPRRRSARCSASARSSHRPARRLRLPRDRRDRLRAGSATATSSS